MPHVIVKLWPGKTEDQKRRLAATIVQGVTNSLGYNEDAVSVAFEEVPPAQWNARVYKPDIKARWTSLAKRPGYGEPPADAEERP
ncbi:tautomerase family protein [Sphingomonas beigongshangi]|jgi:4-oxalocrotonate tautomerase|uniref:tautomerase family protein n=1 Tax=Sphingomonas beigongshangi TaxID=2782540 RepID=UPI001AED5B6F|nr:tautomerase family protein [Sphingomonas beigongshangi]